SGVLPSGVKIAASDPVTIIYTSGTSGEAKGVVLNAANVGFMLGCTSARLDQLMEGSKSQDRVFHYLPFSFCASWIALLTFLKRRAVMTLNTDLAKIATDMPVVAPDYFLNVPQLLERTRRTIEEQVAKKGGAIHSLYSKAKSAWIHKLEGKSQVGEAF